MAISFYSSSNGIAREAEKQVEVEVEVKVKAEEGKGSRSDIFLLKQPI